MNIGRNTPPTFDTLALAICESYKTLQQTPERFYGLASKPHVLCIWTVLCLVVRFPTKLAWDRRQRFTPLWIELLMEKAIDPRPDMIDPGSGPSPWRSVMFDRLRIAHDTASIEPTSFPDNP